MAVDEVRVAELKGASVAVAQLKQKLRIRHRKTTEEGGSYKGVMGQGHGTASR